MCRSWPTAVWHIGYVATPLGANECTDGIPLKFKGPNIGWRVLLTVKAHIVGAESTNMQTQRCILPVAKYTHCV